MNSAFEYGQLDIIKYLMSKGAFIGQIDIENIILKGYLHIIKYLLEQNYNFSRHAREEMLILASRFGNLEIVKYLFEQGIETYKNMALIASSSNGYLEITKFLVEKGAEISYDNEQPLCCAIYSHHKKITEYLINNGAKITKDAIRIAFRQNDFEIIKLVIRKINDINSEDGMALNTSAELGNIRMVKYLVEKCDADLNYISNDTLESVELWDYKDVLQYINDNK